MTSDSGAGASVSGESAAGERTAASLPAGNEFRLAAGGRVRRDRPLRFRFDGVEHVGYQGDTLASALLANGVRRVGTSIRFGRPRGVFAAGCEEPNALVQVEWPFPEPMLPATTLELYDGLVARGLLGKGRLATERDPARYDAVHRHCDVLVVGAGPAGLAAAMAAARSGARVIVADEQREPGGDLLGSGETLDGQPAARWAAAVVAELDAAAEVTVLRRTTVVSYYDDNYLIAVERRTNHLGGAAPAGMARERVWRIRAGQVVLATGAHQRSIAFAGNDRPGVMLAHAARTYLNRYGVLPGRRAVVFTTGDSAYPAAFQLADAGVEIAAIVDARIGPGAVWGRRCADRGITVLGGQSIVAVEGERTVMGVSVALHASASATADRFAADLVLVAGGWNPVVHLYSQAGGRLRYDEGLGAFVPDGSRQAVALAGAAGGDFTLAGCLATGAAAGQRAVEAAGFRSAGDVALPTVDEVPAAPSAVLWMVPAYDYSAHFVDLQRDVTVADVAKATGAGLRSVEHVKRYTTAGTASDQGKTSGVLTGGVVSGLLGVELGELGTTTFRPPYAPVSFAALAGRDRGALHDPVRVTALHDWHVGHGAVFENVGQWKRPRYYPAEGEDMGAAVLRECRAAREVVAFMDASTLGKIDVQGPDAAEYLDRVYTNMMSSLAVGSIRYGVMCRPDGMVLDDGTAIRLADDRYLITTTTGNAAPVLDWMEEWLQTEWPELRVRFTSVTEQWATVAVVGPRSRDVLSALAPSLPMDAESFPFMRWHDTVVAGLDSRVCRISFSGELAYEINVSWWDALVLWHAVLAAGKPFGITPYGTETMHVLRAEKGYPIVGHDTDGTVTPQDLGMSWVVSKKKPDFIGKRSYARADTSRADRKHLVGLLTDDPEVLLPEGTQLITGEVSAPPVPMLGHVTSSYHSAALGRTFALALVRSGRDRLGERLMAAVGATLVPVTVHGPVLFDPEGARRDG